MPRPAPQPGVADAALVGGICAEAFELRIGQCLTRDTDEQDQCAEIILDAQGMVRKARCDKNGKHQRDRPEPLVL
jgi:hypothetical protein